MTVRNSGWEPFSGRVFGSAIDREIGRAIARQGVEQHASFRGRLRRTVGNRTVRTDVTTQTPGDGPKSWAVHEVATKPDGSTERVKLVAEVHGSHTLAELTAAQYLTGLDSGRDAGRTAGAAANGAGEDIERHTLRHRGYLVQELHGPREPTWFVFNDRGERVGTMRIDQDQLRTAVVPTWDEACSAKVPMTDWAAAGYDAIENQMAASVDVLDSNVPAERRAGSTGDA